MFHLIQSVADILHEHDADVYSLQQAYINPLIINARVLFSISVNFQDQVLAHHSVIDTLFVYDEGVCRSDILLVVGVVDRVVVVAHQDRCNTQDYSNIRQEAFFV